MNIVDRVVALQNAEGFNDTEYARQLGVSKGLWSLVKSKQVQPHAKVLGGIWRRYPGLRRDVEQYWMSKLGIEGSAADASTEQYDGAIA